MKKFFMTLAVVMIAVCANAQVYLGGNVGIASVDYGDQITDFVNLKDLGDQGSRTTSLAATLNLGAEYSLPSSLIPQHFDLN